MEYHYISVIRDPASPDIPDGWILKSPDAEFWRVRRTVNVQLPAVWESQAIAWNGPEKGEKEIVGQNPDQARDRGYQL
ncbi:uncharacterized protein BDCG_16299 [Blastomyces dermatitidis ER-3]|uniref:Uncharacterized protein n=2 Tax=Ajellomyces dermatitidis TaxID=5039 RepID=A0A0J9EQJ1_AJEDA|nr:uncharacterized protein BDCG_16299 [Blastomyces dermatitidis ER-3]KMW67470.1 hypothetical protein BDDG_12138 [Blastomyces dermatitidis ATCC 18188]OAS99762.1 hypothetical protein BDCG_16299 [Blastomyces dermatitidis ER-3]